MPRVDIIEAEIFKVEGFKVMFCHADGRDVRADKDGLPSYPYQKAAWKDWRVTQWRGQRFRANYPEYGVRVLLGDGTEAYGGRMLATVRDSYEGLPPDEPGATEGQDESIFVRERAEEATTAVWVVRAGYEGDEEPIALENNVATIHWNELPDLSGIESKEDLAEMYRGINTEETSAQQRIAVCQVWAFRSQIKKGDIVVLPLVRMWHALAIGEVTGPYAFRDNLGNEVRHTLPVEWFIADLPRNRLDPVLTKAIGLPRTVYRIRKPEDAEQRFQAILRDEIERKQRRILKNYPPIKASVSHTIEVIENTIAVSPLTEKQPNGTPQGWRKIGGFGYVCHSYVTFWETPEHQQCVELQGRKSRLVKNLHELGGDGKTLLWTLIKELEREMTTQNLPPGG